MEFKALKSAGLLNSLSDTAKDIYLPDGIFYWSGRAQKEADINATIGSARGRTKHFLPAGDDTVKTFYLPSVMEALKGLDPEVIVSYAKIAGMPAFRDAWRNWVVAKLSAHYEFDSSLLGSPIAVPGATAGIAFLGKLFLSPGDEILCHDKHWENYDLIYSGSQGLKVKTAPLFTKAGGMDIDSFAETVKKMVDKQGCAVAVLNFPNNPTGYMPTREEGKALKAALVSVAAGAKGRIVLIFDDAYEGYVYEKDAAQISIFGDFIGAHPNIIPVKCDGATKEFLMYGGRVAAVTFAMHPEWGDVNAVHSELENKMKALIRGSVSNCNRSVQEAVTVALKNPEKIKEERGRISGALSERYVVLKKALAETDLGGAAADPFNSGFFCMLNIAHQADQFADRLLKEYKVGVIPIVDEKLGINAVRIAFCGVEADMIAEMVGRIASCIKTA